MDTFELFSRLFLALAIGLLIGLERGWHMRDEPEGERAAGFRTHALAGLLGGVWGAIALHAQGGLVALALVFMAFTAVLTLFRYREAIQDRTFGATTVVAAMLAFSLGAYAVLGDQAAAAACAVAATVVLALKTLLHEWVRRLTWPELRSGIVLLAMTFILLPLLPNRAVDPWGAINPFALWLMTIMIAVISFIGYVAMKFVGGRGGSLLTGLAGGLVSSTAVTVALGRLAKDHPGQRNALLAGIVAANATMMARVLAVAGVANVALIKFLALPLALAGAVTVAIAYYYYTRPSDAVEQAGTIDVHNPFELPLVLKFGALLTVISALSKILTGFAGQAGAYALAAVSGIADVDAITLSMAQLAKGSLAPEVAATAIAIVVTVNTISKGVIGMVVGGNAVGVRLIFAATAALAAGLVGLLVMRSF